MGTQQIKKKQTPDVRGIISEVKRLQDLDTNDLVLKDGLEIGFSPTGISTVDFVNVTTNVVVGTQTGT